MRIIDCEPNSPDWHAARCGRVTASRIADIVRKTKDGKASEMRETYLGELIAERLSGVVEADSYQSDAMKRGTETEDKARAYYGFINDVEPARVGFVLHPTIDMAGASPDRLVGNDGLIEVKCPHSKNHVKTLMGAPIKPDYVKQMQWQLACTGRKWVDYVSFDDRLPPDLAMHVIRITRDDNLIKELESATIKFIADVDATISALAAKYRKAG